MSRKKTKKRTKKTASNPLVTIQKMEMEWTKAPVKIIAQLDKQIQANKKQETKLSKKISKINTQVNKAEARVKSADTKKQIKKTNKKLDQVSSTQTALNKQLQTVTTTLATLLPTQSRLIALQKSIKQFNVEWTKSQKAKTSSKVTAKKTKIKPKLVAVALDQQASIESEMDAVTELAS